MTKLSPTQKVQLVLQAERSMGVSLPADVVAKLAAIPIRESGNDPGVHNYNTKTKDDSYGLWEINTWSPSTWSWLQSTLHISSKGQLNDPLTNAKAAVLLAVSTSKSRGDPLWSWGGYKGQSGLQGVDPNELAQTQAAVSGGIPASGMSVAGQANMIDKAINWALTQQGKPYHFGGSSDGSSYDCSSLTAAFLAQMGIQAPALTWSQAKMGRHIDVNSLRPGDLIFMHGSQGDLGHVAIYLGGGLELQAPHTGDVVKISPVNFGGIQEARRFTADSVSMSAQAGGSYRTNVSNVPTTDTTPAGDANAGANAALANASDDEVKDWIRKHYGTMAGFIDDPEVGPILMESARSGWSTQQLIGQLESTNWWKLRNDSQHAWAEKQINDPGQAATDRQTMVSTIVQSAGQLGVTMTAAQVQALAEEALNSGWSTDQVKNQIIGNINWDTSGTQGELQFTAQHMMSLGKQYFVPIDQAQARAWAVAINEGKLTEDGVRATLQTQAEHRWSFLNGVAPGDFWAPVQGAIADELEQPSSAIDLSDPKWAAALERTNKDGSLRPATIEEARIVARNDPSWVRTNKALSQSTNTASDLLKSLTGTGLA